jgi:hypothetical protein
MLELRNGREKPLERAFPPLHRSRTALSLLCKRHRSAVRVI